MTGLTHHFDRLSHEHRVFWCQMAGAYPCNGHNSQIAIDVWERDHGMSRERAVLELMGWLVIARESIGVTGVGHG